METTIKDPFIIKGKPKEPRTVFTVDIKDQTLTVNSPDEIPALTLFELIKEKMNLYNIFPITVNYHKNVDNKEKKQNKDMIKMVYKINKEIDTIRILGENFVTNNKVNVNCKLIINGNEYDLIDIIDYKKYKIDKNGELLTIYLKGVSYITDARYMFAGCESLESLTASKWDTGNVKTMDFMFSNCASLKSLLGISKWDTKNVKNMNNMFAGCESLESLPGISKWDTGNVESMECMFFNCTSLKSLLGISKWDTKNVKNMKSMFLLCQSLQSLPDISKWNTGNVINMDVMFSSCYALQSLPDISKWDTKNVTSMDMMFSDCKSLESLPNISEWNTKKVKDMKDMFQYCKSSLNIPAKFKK